jgi:hypothetical protein
MNNITHKNLEAYLHYFGKQVNKEFSADTINKWKELTEEQVSGHLNKLYQAFQLAPEKAAAIEKDFLASLVVTTPTATATAQPVKKEPAPALISIEKSNRSKRLPWILAGIFIVVAGIGSFIYYKYQHYKKLRFVYTLADNVAIRKNLNEKAEPLGRMDLFGRSLDLAGKVQETFSKLELVSAGGENDFYKVQQPRSFWNYLTGKKPAVVGYVSVKYTTTDSVTHNIYKRIFAALKDDYNEMNELEYSYRTLIVNAIRTYEPSLSVSSSCYIEKKLAADAPLSILQQKKNNQYTVVVRLSDQRYYSIQGNDKFEVTSFLPVNFFDEDNYEEPFTQAGKFRYQKGDMFNAPSFLWTSCDSSIKATSRPPYTTFTEKRPDDSGNDPLFRLPDINVPNLIDTLANRAQELIEDL